MEQLSAEVTALRAWQASLIKNLRKAAGWLALALVLFAAGIGISLWRIADLAEANRKAIVAQNDYDNRLAMEQYQSNKLRWQACKDRNDLFSQQLRQDEAQLVGLIKAHQADGDTATTKFWQHYLKLGREQKTKLPSCGTEPKPPEQEENVP